MPDNASNELTFEEHLNAFIQVNSDNKTKTSQRLDSFEESMKRIEVKIGNYKSTCINKR